MVPVPKGFVPGARQSFGEALLAAAAEVKVKEDRDGAKRSFGSALAAATAEVREHERAPEPRRGQEESSKKRRADEHPQLWGNGNTRQRLNTEGDHGKKQLWRGSRSVVPTRRSQPQNSPERGAHAAAGQDRHNRSRRSHEHRSHKSRSRHRERSRPRRSDRRRRDGKPESGGAGKRSSRNRNHDDKEPWSSSRPSHGHDRSSRPSSAVGSREYARSEQGSRAEIANEAPAARRGLWRGSRSVVPQRTAPKAEAVAGKAVPPAKVPHAPSTAATAPSNDKLPSRGRALGVAVAKSSIKTKANAVNGPRPPPGAPPTQAKAAQKMPQPMPPPSHLPPPLHLPAHPPVHRLSRPHPAPTATAPAVGLNQSQPAASVSKPAGLATSTSAPWKVSGGSKLGTKPTSLWHTEDSKAQEAQHRGQKRPLEPPGSEPDPLRRAFEEHVATAQAEPPGSATSFRPMPKPSHAKDPTTTPNFVAFAARELPRPAKAKVAKAPAVPTNAAQVGKGPSAPTAPAPKPPAPKPPAPTPPAPTPPLSKPPAHKHPAWEQGRDMMKVQAKQHAAKTPLPAKPSAVGVESRLNSDTQHPAKVAKGGKTTGKGKTMATTAKKEEYLEDVAEDGTAPWLDTAVQERETEDFGSDLSARLRRTVERSEQLLEEQRRVLAGQPDALKQAEALHAELAALRRDAARATQAAHGASKPAASASSAAATPASPSRSPAAVIDLSAKEEPTEAVAETYVANDERMLDNGLRVFPREHVSFTGDWEFAEPAMLRLTNSSRCYIAVKVMLNSRGAYTVMPSHQHTLKPGEIKELRVKAVGQSSPDHRIVVRSVSVAKQDVVDKHFWAKLTPGSYEELWLSVRISDVALAVGAEEPPVSSKASRSEAEALAAELRRLGVQGGEGDDYGEAAPAYDEDGGAAAVAAVGRDDDVSGQSSGPICPTCSQELVWSNYAEGPYAEAWSCNNINRCDASSSSHGRWRWFCETCQNDLCKTCWDQAMFAGGTGFDDAAEDQGQQASISSANVFAEAEWYASATSTADAEHSAGQNSAWQW